MKKTILKVPGEVRYLSQWEGFLNTLPMDQHFILNKKACGCGATDFFISTSQKVIIAAPRKHLLYDKFSQHIGKTHLYRFIDKKQYFSNRTSSIKDLLAYKENLLQYVYNGGTKILTTYDSLQKLVDIIPGEISEWIVAVDEFQAIFYDSVIKSQTEVDFMNTLSKFKTVIYLSATPYLEQYLDLTSQFSSLPMVELEWPANLIHHPDIEMINMRSRTITDICCEIIEKYRCGNGNTKEVDGVEFKAYEAIFYLNHVDLIVKIIEKTCLKPSEVSVICSGKPENRKKLESLSSKLGDRYCILEDIPKHGEPRTMFTFATSTAYIGCDFYSDNAYSYIFANPSVDSLATDVSTDIQQIIGRQRCIYPFSDSATLYYSTKAVTMTKAELEESIKKKNEETMNAIANYEAAPHKSTQLAMIEKSIQKSAHKTNYCSISKDASGCSCVVKNDLLEIAERRAWDIKNAIFSNDWSLYHTLSQVGNTTMALDSDSESIQRLFHEWIKDGNFSRKAQLYCDMYDEIPDALIECKFIEKKYHDYHYALGREGLESLQWREDYIKKALTPIPDNPFEEKPKSEIARRLIERLREGENHTKAEVKSIIREIYDELEIPGRPSASDVSEYMTISEKSVRKGKSVSTMIHIDSYARKQVSLFGKITDVKHAYAYSIDDVLEMIRKGDDYDLRSKTAAVRNAGNDTDKNEAKLNLPAICYNGTFSGRNQNLLRCYSSFTALDFDHVMPERMTELKGWLQSISCVYAYFVSPSGSGLKALIYHDNYDATYHADLYEQLLEMFSCTELDRKTSDLARGNFLCYDPNVWKNPAPVSFHYEPSMDSVKVSNNASDTVVVNTSGLDIVVQDDDFVRDFLLTLSRQVISDDSIIRILRKRWNGAAATSGRNNAALSYLGVLCKAGVDRQRAISFVAEVLPDLPPKEIEHASLYAYSHNIFGCDRRRYR